MDVIDNDIEVDLRQLKKYKMRIIVARSIMYAIVGLSTFGFISSLSSESNIVVPVIAIVFFLGLTVLSHKAPYIAFILFSAFWGLCSTAMISAFFNSDNDTPNSIAIAVAYTIVIALVSLFFVRGIFAAKKHEQLLGKLPA